MKNKYIIISVIAVALISSLYLYFYFNSKTNFDLSIKPKKGDFKISVVVSGELQAKNSIEIMGPNSAQNVGIWQMKIEKLVDEGKIVKQGEFVAELDKSEIMNRIKDVEINIQKFSSQYTEAKLDSTLNLTKSRDEIENQKFGLEEKRLEKDQSAFEAPAIQRQAQLALEKEERSYDQNIKSYVTKVQQAIAKLQQVGADLSKEQQKMQKFMDVLKGFTITAPAPGMVIYAREWSGKRRVVGSQISSWDPVVAKLPDLSSMESITYVNEVDIQKIKLGQKVKIGLDAAPNKHFTGEVVKVANIGEQQKNSDSKVFEVHIRVNEKDTTLLPAMTTSNDIVVDIIPNSLYINLEAIHNENINGKNIVFVFKKIGNKIVKQQVELGQMNDNEVIILKGLNDNDEILLHEPKDVKNIELLTLNSTNKK